MILGSHNSWSYLPVKQWYLKPLAFTARCQSENIITQYERYGVRCFDLRVRFTPTKGITVAHGIIEYKYSWFDIIDDLTYLNSKGDCYLRILHEARNKKQYTEFSKNTFIDFCDYITRAFKNINIWCGRNLYNWEFDYNFGEEPSCEENYASVKAPKIIDDWWPWFYAKTHNEKIIEKGTDKDILLMDFVNLV